MDAYERVIELAKNKQMRLNSQRHVSAAMNVASLGAGGQEHVFTESVLEAVATITGSLTVRLHYWKSEHLDHIRALARAVRVAKNLKIPIHDGGTIFGEKWAHESVRDIVRAVDPMKTNEKDWFTFWGFWFLCAQEKMKLDLHPPGPYFNSIAAWDHALDQEAWSLNGDELHDARVNEAWDRLRIISGSFVHIIYGFPFRGTCSEKIATYYSHSNYGNDMTRNDTVRAAALAARRPADKPGAFWYRLANGGDDARRAQEHKNSALYADTKIVFYEPPTTSEEHLDGFCNYVEGWCS